MNWGFGGNKTSTTTVRPDPAAFNGINDQAKIAQIEQVRKTNLQVYNDVAAFVQQQDKKNFQLNQQLINIDNEFKQIEQEQNSQQDLINIISNKQSQLFDMIKNQPETQNYSKITLLAQQIIEAQNFLQEYEEKGLNEMKKINDLCNYLTAIKEELK